MPNTADLHTKRLFFFFFKSVNFTELLYMLGSDLPVVGLEVLRLRTSITRDERNHS